VVVGLTGNFPGFLSKPIPPRFATVIVGAFYSLAGLFLLTLKKWGAVLGILFLSAEVLGRIYLVLRGVAPSKGGDALKILVGGLIALALVVSVGFQWKKFDCVGETSDQRIRMGSPPRAVACPRLVIHREPGAGRDVWEIVDVPRRRV
jgi:hypothetical protein